MMLVSVREFSAETGIKEGQLRDLTFARTFPCTRIGKRVYIFHDQALKWIEAHEGKTVDIKRTTFR